MPDSPLDLASLLDDAIAEALSHEDPERFLAWFRDHAADYETGSSTGELLDPPFVAALGRSIWNALPLPGHGFKPRPLPEPGRNDPCVCGSGKKYKQCCSGRPTLPLDPQQILPAVLDRAEPETLQAQARGGRVPVEALVQAAVMRHERGELWNTADLLEHLFAGEIRRPGESHGRALDLLCDVYMALGHEQRKEALLERVVHGVERSRLRSDAWQRIAVIRLDREDAEGAWEAFRHAQQDDPDAPGVGLLEIQLLMSRGRAAEASERAAFWKKRLRKQGRDEDDRLVIFFSRTARDPHAVMSEMGVKAAGGAGGRLLNWIEAVAGRPLPDYTAGPGAGDDAGGSGAERLKLIAPDTHAPLTERWRAVFPLGKPDSLDGYPPGEAGPWEAHHEQTWMDFLEAHPEAFDNLDILDDLAAALSLHPQFGAAWLDHAALEPVLSRAEAILRRALEDRSHPRLDPDLPDNLPALRALAARVELESRRGNDTEAERARAYLHSLVRSGATRHSG